MIVLVRLVTDPIVYVAIIGLFAAPIAAWITWLLNGKKRNSENASSIASATSVAINAIQDVMATLIDDLNATRDHLEGFKQQNEELENSIRELKVQNDHLLEENLKLSSEIDQLREQINRMTDV